MKPNKQNIILVLKHFYLQIGLEVARKNMSGEKLIFLFCNKKIKEKWSEKISNTAGAKNCLLNTEERKYFFFLEKTQNILMKFCSSLSPLEITAKLSLFKKPF